MRSTRARRAAMIGTAALLLVAPCVALAQAEPAAPAPALPADMVAAIQRDLGLSPDQYLERAQTGQELATFAETLRGKFPAAFSGAWLDEAGTPLVGLTDGPDKAAARTAVEAAGYHVKDQTRSERTLSDLHDQLDTWIQQLPAPLAGLVNGTVIDPAANDIALEVKDTAGGQGLQLPDFLNFVRVAKGPALDSPEPPALGSSGSSDPTRPTEPTKTTEPTTTTTKPTEPTTTKPSEPTSTITLDPITAAPNSNEYTLTAKITPAAAGGTVEFKDGNEILGSTKVEADGTATRIWYAQTDGKHTITATFSGRDGVTGSTTTQEVTVAPADNNTVASTITLDPIKAATIGEAITLKAKVNPAAAGGTVSFEVNENSRNLSYVVPVGADGTATMNWTPENAGKATVDATFSGRDGVTGSTTTQQLTITAAATTTKPKPPASDAILGGDVYNTKNDDDKPFICSFGFNGTDGSGHAVNITAGHCDLDPLEAGTLYASRAYERYGNDFNFLGTFDKSTVAGMDYGVIKIDDSVAKRFENNFVRAAPGSDPVPITGTADPVVGAPACKAGVRTGYTCGTITAINMRHTMKSITYKDAIFSNICSNTGDSGGPLITGTKALGITSGGSFAGQCNKPGLRTVSTPIKSILADNPGLKVRTN